MPNVECRRDFGRDHWFRIYPLPVMMVGRYPCFRYGGFWFPVVDPWPESWSDNWYDTDGAYIDYSDGGYYLYNRSHPDVQIAVNAYMN